VDKTTVCFSSFRFPDVKPTAVDPVPLQRAKSGNFGNAGLLAIFVDPCFWFKGGSTAKSGKEHLLDVMLLVDFPLAPPASVGGILRAHFARASAEERSMASKSGKDSAEERSMASKSGKECLLFMLSNGGL
jgi:hypothetical protein